MALSTHNGDLRISGGLSCESFNPPAGWLEDEHVAVGAAIDAAKVNHRLHRSHTQDLGSAVAAKTVLIHTAEYAGSLAGVNIAITTHPTTTDTVVVDVKKSTGAGAFASVLSSAYTLDSSSADRTVYNATISSSAYVAGDIFQVAVTVTGTSGQGLIVDCIFEENGV